MGVLGIAVIRGGKANLATMDSLISVPVYKIGTKFA